MPKFSNKSKEILSWANPDLRKVLNKAIDIIDFTVLQSTRTEEEHNKNVESGNSKTTWDKSKHRAHIDCEGRLTSDAVDIAPYPVDFKDRERYALLAGIILGIAKVLRDQGTITSRIRWGGDWNMNNVTKDESFSDLGHFEVIGE